MENRLDSEQTRRPERRAEWALLITILLAAAFLRLWQLGSTPPGLTHDESNNVHDAAAVLDGVRPLYFPVAQGKEPLYPYSVAALMALLGRSPLVMRLSSAIWGLLLAAVAYAWTRRAFGPAVALLATAGLAVSFWPVAASRMGLRAITLPVLFTASAYFLWRGTSDGSRSAYPSTILSGALLGLTFYTYLASRLMPAVPIAFFLYRLLFHRERRRRHRWGWLLFLAAAAAVAAPLFLYLNAHPTAEIRIDQLDRPLRALLAGDLSPLLSRAGQAIQIFSFHGDTFLPYNLPGKPLLDPLMSVLFYAGLLLALWRWRRPAYAFALLWLVVGFAPALITGIEAANLRAIAMQPVLYLFPALALAEAGRSKKILVPGVVVLFFLIAGLTFRDYFLRWAAERDVRVHYHVDLIAVADVIRRYPDEAIAVSALYPGQYHDPRVVEAELGGTPGRLRWFDGRGGLAMPAGDQAILILPAGVPIAPPLQPLITAPHLELVQRITLRPDDLVPYLEVYRATISLEGIEEGRIGEQLLFLGANLQPNPLAPGQTADLLTSWQIIGQLAAEREAVLFAQALGPDGTIIAQEDRLDAPSWNWQVGDRFVQLFRLTLPAGLAAGNYRLILGAYTVPDRVEAVLAGREPDPTTPRLPVFIKGQPAGDFIELPAITVTAGG